MNSQRPPPSGVAGATAAGGGGSQPDLSKLGSAESKITSRKRKQPSDQVCVCSNEIKVLQTELTRIGSLLEKYVGSNEQIMTKMQESLSEVKTELSELKSSNEQTISLIRSNLTQINEIKTSTSTIKSEQNDLKKTVAQLQEQMSVGQHTIKLLESELQALKCNNQPATSMSENHILSSNEGLIKEMQDRQNREKNIILVGLPEQTITGAEERILKDETDVLNITTMVSKELPKPFKILRIGKYSSERNRLIKVCYETSGPAKQLLRNKEKLPADIKIFSDQTPAQQKYLKNLKEELVRRQNNGDTELTIKYVNGTPSIIKTSPKNSKQ